MEELRTSGIDRRTILRVGSIATLATLAGCLGDDDEQDDEQDDETEDDGLDEHGDEIIEWYAGGQGGTYYPLSIEFKSILDDLTEYPLRVHTTGGSVENVRSLGQEEADFALVQNDIASFARHGDEIDRFEADPVPSVRGIATLYPETIHVLTREDANIDSLEDLEGKRINTGDDGSGTQVNALTLLEELASLQPGVDFTEENTAFGPAVEQLRDGDIDAAFVVGGWPVGAVQDLAETGEMSLLDFAENIDTAVGAADWFAADTIPGGTYTGIEEDVTTVSVQAMIATHTGVDADVVEEITETLFDNLEEIPLNVVEFIDRDTALEGMSIELHEGASRLFE